MTNVINTTGREPKDSDHVWWDEQAAAYIITGGTKAHADCPQATWLGMFGSGMFTAVTLALATPQRNDQ